MPLIDSNLSFFIIKQNLRFYSQIDISPSLFAQLLTLTFACAKKSQRRLRFCGHRLLRVFLFFTVIALIIVGSFQEFFQLINARFECALSSRNNEYLFLSHHASYDRHFQIRVVDWFVFFYVSSKTGNFSHILNRCLYKSIWWNFSRDSRML